MAVVRVFVAIFAVIVGILLSLYFNQPVPEDLPDDAYQSLRALGALLKVFGVIDKLGVIIGVWNHMEFVRSALDFSTRMVNTEDSAVKFQDTHIAGVQVRVFRPAEPANKEKLPAVLFYHGGGMAVGSVDTHHEACQTMTKQAHVVVVSVQYRLAPAHTFPSAFDDCYAVAKALLKGEDKHGIDPSRVVLMGDSAGGNLAAAVTLKLRGNKKKPAAQVLIYPALQFMDLNLPSFRIHNNWILDQTLMSRYWSLYLTGSDMGDMFISGNHSTHLQRTKYASYIGDTNVDHSKAVEPPQKGIPQKVLNALTDPRASPLMADDLTGLPPTFIMTCEFDVLKNDGILYKERLLAAGTEVTFKNYMSYHAVFSLGRILPHPVELQNMFSDVAQFLKKINHAGA